MEDALKNARLRPTDGASRFSSRVGHYAKFRPGYPAELLEILRQQGALPPGAAVADIGSGTGLSSRLFLDAGHAVWAIEPNAEMRAAAEAAYAQNSQFHSVAASGELTTLPAGSMDLVFCAQAFHWLDPQPAADEFLRILKPRGHIALVWNERKLTGSAFLEGYEALLRTFGTDYAVVARRLSTVEEFIALFGLQFTRTVVPNQQDFVFEGLQGRLLSASYAPPESSPQFAPMLAALRRLFDETSVHGLVAFEYQTEIFLCRTKPSFEVVIRSR